jgi:hypothetical protein
MPTIKWITGVYAIRFTKDGPPRSSISVPLAGRSKLQEMADDLVGTENMVGAYLTIGGPRCAHPEIARGRVIGAACLLEMPKGGRMEDYPCENLGGAPRWPLGWPVKWIYLPPEDRCPELREYVKALIPGGNLRRFTEPLQIGPLEISPTMGAGLTADLCHGT